MKVADQPSDTFGGMVETEEKTPVDLRKVSAMVAQLIDPLLDPESNVTIPPFLEARGYV